MDVPEIESLNNVARRLKMPFRWLKTEAEAGRIPVLNAGGSFQGNAESIRRVLARRLPQPEKFLAVMEAAHA